MTQRNSPGRLEKGTSDPLIEAGGVIQRPDGLKHLTPMRAAAFLGLVRAGQTLDQVLNAELEAEHGISLRAFEILLFLAVFSEDGRLPLNDLTREAPLSQSQVSRLVATLEDRGLVERTPSSSDGRGVVVTITESGIDKFKAAQDTHLAGLDQRLYSQLSKAEVEQLAATTTKILKACRDG